MKCPAGLVQKKTLRARDGVREVEGALRELGIERRPIEVHVSVRSFGGLEDGPATIVDGVLAAGSTVLAATMAPDLFGAA